MTTTAIQRAADAARDFDAFLLVGDNAYCVLVSSLRAPQFSYATNTNNFTTLRFDPAIGELRVSYTNGAGTTFHTESFVVD